MSTTSKMMTLAHAAHLVNQANRRMKEHMREQKRKAEEFKTIVKMWEQKNKAEKFLNTYK